MGLLTDRITNKSEKSNLTDVRAPSHEPVPLTNRFHLAVYDNVYIISRCGKNKEVPQVA